MQSLAITRTKFLQLMLDGLTAKEACAELGIGAPIGSLIAASLRDKLALDLEINGLTNEHIIKRMLMPALEANQVKYFSHQGIVTEERVGPDWTARLNALHVLLKLKGSYAPRNDDSDEESGDGSINVNIRVIGGGDQVVVVDAKDT